MSNVVYIFGDDEKSASERAKARQLLLKRAEQAQLILQLRAEARAREQSVDPKTNPLRSATAILVYHPSYGRNAWHSTWIKRYRSNTLLSSWDEARKYVNANRVQGSTYRLTVMPAIHLDFGVRQYLVAEINTARPFKRLNEPRFLQSGISEKLCLDLLNPKSLIWSKPNPAHDSVIVQRTPRPSSMFVAYEDRTSARGQTQTLGRYQRVVTGNEWFFSSIEGSEKNIAGEKYYRATAFERTILPAIQLLACK